MEEKMTSAVDWSRYLPPQRTRDTGPKEFAPGQVWATKPYDNANGVTGRYALVFRVTAVRAGGGGQVLDCESLASLSHDTTEISNVEWTNAAVLLLAAGRPESDLMPPGAYFGGGGVIVAPPAPAVVDGSTWKLRDKGTATRSGFDFAQLGQLTCTVTIRNGAAFRVWPNGLHGTSTMDEFLDNFVPADATALAPAAPPVVDTYETRQAAHVARTDALMRRLKLDAGCPECVTCHRAVERVGKSGMCPACWGASRGAKLDGDLAYGGATARAHSLVRVAASQTPVAPWTPSVYAADLPDA